MTNLHIIGKPRSGKGVLMTFLSLMLADSGGIINSNYHMDSPNVNFISFYDLLNFLKKSRQNPPRTNNIDELPGWCDSYVSSSKSSRFASHFLNQSAKLGYDMIFSSQRSMRADINFRELREAALKAERVEGGFIYHVLDPDETEEDVDTGRTIKLTDEMASCFWNRFDTFEAVPPIGLDEVLMEMQKFDHKKLDETITQQCNALLEAYPNEACATVNGVSELLLSLGESRQFAGLVHARLQRIQRQTRQQTNKTPMTQGTAPQTHSEDRTLVWQRWRK